MGRFITGTSISNSGEQHYSMLKWDVLSQLEDDDLLHEIQERGLYLKAYTSDMITYCLPEKQIIYRELCDIAEVNYHTDINTLLEIIKNKIK